MNKVPRCPHFDLCSGCEILLDEPPLIEENVRLFFKPFSIYPVLHRGSPTEWRLKAKLAIRGSFQNPIIGLFEKGTHKAIPIPHCLVHHPSINHAAHFLRSAIQKSGVSIYDETSQTGLLRYAQFFVQRDSGKVQLTLVVSAQKLSSELKRLCEHFQEELWHSLWINFQIASTNRILGDEWRHLSGEKWLYQRFLDSRVPFHPGAFAQANFDLFEKLVERVQSWTPPKSRIVELFAGVGLIGASLKGHSCLIMVENNPFAADSFRERFPENGPGEYRLEDASAFEDFRSVDLVIVDPPRKGLGSALLKKLMELHSGRLIYVSCGWDSFQSDSLALINAGWKLKKAETFFLFPGTNQVETLALFEK